MIPEDKRGPLGTERSEEGRGADGPDFADATRVATPTDSIDAEAQRLADELGLTLPAGVVFLGEGRAMVLGGSADDLLAAATVLERLDDAPGIRRRAG